MRLRTADPRGIPSPLHGSTAELPALCAPRRDFSGNLGFVRRWRKLLLFALAILLILACAAVRSIELGESLPLAVAVALPAVNSLCSALAIMLFFALPAPMNADAGERPLSMALYHRSLVILVVHPAILTVVLRQMPPEILGLLQILVVFLVVFTGSFLAASGLLWLRSVAPGDRPGTSRADAGLAPIASGMCQ